jgi:threonine dehydrogenase-like Zn-dependent dehydrogenase
LRRETAFRSGCCEVFNPEVEPANLDNSFELVVDAVGMEASRRMAIRVVRPGGVMMHIGLQQSGGDCDFRKITLSEITVIGTYTYTHADLEEALKILHSGALGDLSWVEERPLSEGATAFSDLNKGFSAASKIVLQPLL